MKVIIAEKPSVAREIAAVVGAAVRRDGYIEGNGYAVTWAFGHLVGPAMPEAYGVEGFHWENLPILPETFILEPRKVKSGKAYKPDPGAEKQLGILKELFDKAERIIVATDAGREGELIFRLIYEYLGCHTPFDRLWISSLTDRAIREGLQNIRPGSEYDNLYLSARARSEADWIVGINASQALAIAAGRGTWSLGRVQTPTLALVCQRYLENTAFTPQTYFRLKLHTAGDATAFAALSTERYDTKEAADTVRKTVMEANTVQVTKVERREVKEQPPLLYDLTTLQKDANTRYGFSAEKTLEIAQALYEAKFISYPRTGSRYIPEDVLDGIYPLLTPLWGNPRFGYQAVAVSNSELNRHSVDDKKVTDHHALLTTDTQPDKLTPEQEKIYEMIAARMVEAFAKECWKYITSVRLECAGIAFEVRGTVVKRAGWRKVWGEQQERTEDEAAALPSLAEGDTLPVRGCDLLEKQTRPRPLHTESSLLAAMETAGKELEDEAEREAMKDSGLGTPATRAAVIETLFSREYIKREPTTSREQSGSYELPRREGGRQSHKKSLLPTDKGLAVYEIVKDMRIADAAMTGGWELALSKIASGEMDAFAFRKGIEVYASQIVSELLAARIEGADDRPGAKCPRCGGRVVFFPKVAKCQNAECGLTVFRTVAKKELSDAQLTELLTKGRTGTIKGFAKTNGETFDAAVTLDGEYKAVFDFGPRKAGKGGKPGGPKSRK
ncbi:type IA DNA topoisomerase [Alistipes indistinctus]|uniref:type IA DNA topoisomerase n=1 Tax=Alistipes indistinctus TaxID=626932 RepID=UPI0015F1E94F|nr:type IA DNA topoisomerase [Alistipes indistinctus]BCG54368.1 DNA topoisomerase [Alistipes indistinctus]